jgi:site-specific DNA-methyltransferase (adenine-specific)
MGLNSPRAGAGRRGGARNIHPTVKPIALMQWLCRLVTPPGGIVLDPFAGSGTTLVAALRCGFRAIGIEREAQYAEIARGRVEEDAPLFRRARDPEPTDAPKPEQTTLALGGDKS